MKKLLKVLPLLAALTLAAACDVHEIPHGYPLVSLTLDLKYSYDITQYTTIDFRTRAGVPDNGYQARYIVRLYKYASDDWQRTPAYEYVYYSNGLDDLDRRVRLEVEPANYHVIAWTDYVEAATMKDYYYDASDFSELKLTGEYSGCDVRRDGFFGSADLELASILVNGGEHEATVEMGRPFARYNLISMDKEQFIDYWIQQIAMRDGTMVKTDRQNINLNKFKVKFIYPQYLPSTFNLHSGKPVDSTVGVSFWTTMSVREDGDVDLGFDYVFVNPTETKVNLMLEIYDDKGTYISTVSDIVIPLMRSQQTTVKGKILTSGISSGISIDPTYDGEFNIQI